MHIKRYTYTSLFNLPLGTFPDKNDDKELSSLHSSIYIHMYIHMDTQKYIQEITYIRGDNIHIHTSIIYR
jgi:hypothetical protein